MNLYFDNAATSHPKPEQVYLAVTNYFRNIGGNPGRASHAGSLNALRMIFELREKLARLFNISDPSRIAFSFNATDALNMAIKGYVNKGEHIIHTSMEHNSVLRPVAGMCKKNIIESTVIPADKKGLPDLDFLADSIKDNTKLLIINHASNVCGTIQPIEMMIEIAHSRNVKVLLDAAQTAGILPIDVQRLNIDMLAFCGHKGLLGPPGTGALYLSPDIDIQPWREGGTGSFSDRPHQPEYMPDRLEAGTLNSVGLAGLSAALDFINNETVEKISSHEQSMLSSLKTKLNDIEGLKLIGNHVPCVAVISFIVTGYDCADVSLKMEQDYGLMCRTGLHCAPLAHKALGTFPQGTVRISPGYFNTEKEIDYLVNSLRNIVLDDRLIPLKG